jgi:hypothetical protein
MVEQNLFSVAELTAFAEEHIQYEVATLVQAATLWAAAPGLLGPIAHSALLESALVHLRLLDDFLGKDSQYRHKDDVLAIDYLDSWKQEYVLDGSDRNLINAQVAHLSMRRQAGQLWDVVGLSTPVLDRCAGFFTQLQAAGSEYTAHFASARRILVDFRSWYWEQGHLVSSAHQEAEAEAPAATSSTRIISLPLFPPLSRGS